MNASVVRRMHVHHVATHYRLGACFHPIESLGPGPPLHSIPYALGYGEEALARIESVGARPWYEDHYSAIPGDCCSTKGRADHQPPLAACLVQIYGGSLTEFVGEQSLTALICRIGPGIPEIKPLRDGHDTNSKQYFAFARFLFLLSINSS